MDPLDQPGSAADPTPPAPADEQDLWAAVGGLEASYFHGTGEAGAAAQPPDPGAEQARTTYPRPAELPQEMRALWVTRWDWRTKDDLLALAEKAARANFNALFFQVRGNADALYASHLEPWSALLAGSLGQDPGWDPLHLAVETAHAHNLELHAWVNAYPAWLGESAPPAVTPEPMFLRFNRLYGDSWVVWDRQQQPMPLNKQYLWANPGHCAVLEHVARVCQDILARYLVDGLHLDNVRYPGLAYSHDPLTADRVAAAQVLEPGLSQRAWQRYQVDHLVAGIHRAVNHHKPGLPLSAAVWPVYQDTWPWWQAGDGYDGYCQDSVGWVLAGCADHICPMFYLGSIKEDDSQYQDLLEDFVTRAGGDAVVAGITATYDSFEIVARRIDLARQAGAAGQAIFSYGHLDHHNYWQALRTGPYATPAAVPAPKLRAPTPLVPRASGILGPAPCGGSG